MSYILSKHKIKPEDSTNELTEEEGETEASQRHQSNKIKSTHRSSGSRLKSQKLDTQIQSINKRKKYVYHYFISIREVY